MNDSTNYSYLEASAKRKKRNQFISILIIVAVVLAVVVGWGVREFKKSQDAERIKNALNSQVEPAFPMPSETGSSAPLVDSASMQIDDAQETKSTLTETTLVQPAVEPTPVAEPPVSVPTPKPVIKPVKPKPEVAAPATTPAAKPEVAVKAPAEVPKVPVEATPVAKPAPVAPVVVPPTPPPAPVVAMVEPAKPVVAPAVTPAPTKEKVFAPEDMPLPTKVEPSDEGLSAAAAIPKMESAVAATPSTASEHFKTGLEAYRQADFVNAIRAFAALSKPTSRKRGEPERDEYVQGNFLRGVALLKMQHISEAATAFQNALEYEKYYPLANMNLGICYIELKQYAKAHKCFEAVIRDQSFVDPSMFDDVMQRTRYFWALAWTRLCKGATDPDRQNYYRQQATLRWKDYLVWFGKNDKYKSENQKADNYLKSLAVF
jgi:hypothetical protein